MNAELLGLLTCPVCRDSELLGLDEQMVDGALSCSRCEATYPVRNGIPILLPPDLDTSGVHDELDHAQRHKQGQVDYLDREVAEEFEISRPYGTPLAYRWLMEEKFRRSVAKLPPLKGATVLDACSGSGMDAEFLLREGARVIALDISESCALRARSRAERQGLDYLVVVGDVRRLPVRTGAADIAYVHDGFHHLDEPALGIRELARVARLAVSINEPADALATKFAVRLGMALREEGAGNPVVRLRAQDVSDELQRAGFHVEASRYIMYYQHEPGRVMRFVSRPGVYQLYQWALRLVNRVVGAAGNKLQVAAVRER